MCIKPRYSRQCAVYQTTEWDLQVCNLHAQFGMFKHFSKHQLFEHVSREG